MARQPKIPRAQTNPLQQEEAFHDDDLGSPDQDEEIQKGMTPRNLKTIGAVALLVVAFGFLLIPGGGKQKKPEVQVKPVTDNVVNDLIGGLERAPQPYVPQEIKPPAPPPAAEKVVIDERLQAALIAPMAASDVTFDPNARRAADSIETSEQRMARRIAEQRAAVEESVRKSQDRQLEAMRLAAAQAAPEVANMHDTQHDRFLAKHEDSDIGHAVQLQGARSPHTLYEGTIIRATLTRALKTDLPGTITAKVSSDLYDTVTQRTLLVPRGSEITCSYQSTLMVGQKLVLAACTRLRLPNGKSFALGGAAASDMAGATGLPAKIDNHFMEMFGNALIVGAASFLLPSGDRNISSTTTASGTEIAGSIMGTALNQIISATIARNINIPPTGIVNIGSPFTLTLARDVELEPYFRR